MAVGVDGGEGPGVDRQPHVDPHSAVVVAYYIGPRERWLTHPIVKPFILCGRHSLHIFCIGILLAVLGHLILNEFFGGIVMQAAVTAGGIAIMIGVAALMDWFRTSESTTSESHKRQRAALRFRRPGCPNCRRAKASTDRWKARP